jgi:hypothetical protein
MSSVAGTGLLSADVLSTLSIGGICGVLGVSWSLFASSLASSLFANNFRERL